MLLNVKARSKWHGSSAYRSTKNTKLSTPASFTQPKGKVDAGSLTLDKYYTAVERLAERRRDRFLAGAGLATLRPADERRPVDERRPPDLFPPNRIGSAFMVGSGS